MEILVTGAAGMIGSRLVDVLLAAGHRVVGLDNLLTGQQRNLDSAIDDPSFHFVLGDVADATVMHSIGPVDRVFHLACPPSPKDFSTMPTEILSATSAGTMAVASFALQHSARLVLASTSEVYGEPEVHPQPEWYRGHVDSTGPRACYDEGKRFSEAVVTSFVRSRGLDGAIARIFNTYGPRMRTDDGRVVSNFVVQALRGDPLTVQGDGDQTRSFCFVDDLVSGLEALMDSGESGPFNLGNDDEHTVCDLADIVIELTGSSSPIEHRPLPTDDPTRRRPDLSAALERLGWKPTTPLREGLAMVIDHHRGELAGR